MTLEMWVTLAILVAALVLFVTEAIRLDLVALGVMVALMLTGMVTIEEGLAGFSNKAVISIGALFIVGGAIFHTGLAAMIAERILKAAGGDVNRLLIVMMISVALMSAFISSTGVMALMLPAVVSLARSLRVSTSKLMIPMAFSALLGGTLTLIATPPNLLASEALYEAGFQPFDFFSFTPMGLVLVVVGIVYMVLIGSRLLPNRKAETGGQAVTTPSELFALYELPGSLFHLRVQEDSPLVGQTVGASGLGQDYNLTIVTITRSADSPRPIIPIRSRSSAQDAGYVPLPETPLLARDALVVRGSAESIAKATAALKLAVMAAEPVVEDEIITNEVGIAEVLLRPRSEAIGRTIAEMRFAHQYRLTVLDLKRPGSEPPASLKNEPLKFGDVLLVQGEWKHIFALKRQRSDFIVMGEPEALQFGAGTRPEKAPITLLVLLGMVVAVAFNLIDLAPASILASIIVILTGCLNVDQAYATIDLKTLFLMAGMLPMSTALQKVGLIDLFAGGLVDTLGPHGPLMVQIGLFVVAGIVSQMLSNTTTAVLMAPLALAAAQQLGVQPHGMMMSIAIAASMAFVTPLASPVNTLVMSTGHYRFMDYVKVGFPLLVLTLIVSSIIVPLLLPY